MSWAVPVPALRDITGRRRGGYAAHIVLAALVILGAVLRLAHLGARSLSLDEGVTVALTRLNWSQFFHVLLAREANMTLYYFLLLPWTKLGSSESTLRALSAIAGIATIPLVYKLGERLFDRRVGWVSALLLCVQAAHVAYSQEARGYSLVVFFSVTAWWFFVGAVQDGSRKHWALYAASTGAAVYCHFFALLLVPAQFLALLARPRGSVSYRGVLGGAAGVMILAIPVLLFMLSRDVQQLGWVHATDFRGVFHVATFLTGSGIRLLLYVVFWGIAAAGFGRVWQTHGRSLEAWPAAVVLSWLFVPVLATLVASFITPLLVPRFLIICVPASVMLAAIGIVQVRPRWMQASALALLVVLSASSVLHAYGRTSEDWRSASRYVLQHAQPGDAVLFYPPLHWPFDYYRGLWHVAPDQPVVVGGDDVPRHPAVRKLASQYKRMWLVFYGHPAANDFLANDLKTSLSVCYQPGVPRMFDGMEVFLYSKPTGSPSRN